MKKIKRTNGKLVLGDGESTGHQHTVATRGATLWQLDNPELMQLKMPTPSLLRHTRGDAPAEHRDIQLPSGEPVISHKRAWSPEGWTRVVD